MFLRNQWKKSQALADMFSRRGVKEVSPDLLPRRKRNEEEKPMQVGDVVIVAVPNSVNYNLYKFSKLFLRL